MVLIPSYLRPILNMHVDVGEELCQWWSRHYQQYLGTCSGILSALNILSLAGIYILVFTYFRGYNSFQRLPKSMQRYSLESVTFYLYYYIKGKMTKFRFLSNFWATTFFAFSSRIIPCPFPAMPHIIRKCIRPLSWLLLALQLKRSETETSLSPRLWIPFSKTRRSRCCLSYLSCQQALLWIKSMSDGCSPSETQLHTSPTRSRTRTRTCE